MKVAIRDSMVEPKSLDELAKGLVEVGASSFELWINRHLTTIWGESLAAPDKLEAFAK